MKSTTTPDRDVGSSDSSAARKNFLTPQQCAEQFEMYAQSNPSKDSQHSLRFCANFLREFCVNPEPLREALTRIATGASLPITDEHPTALIRAEIEDIARKALSLPNNVIRPK